MPERIEFDSLRSVLGSRIRELRRARGLSQEDLADRAGCHRTYIGMLERREGNPSLGILFQVADALGVTVVDLLT